MVIGPMPKYGQLLMLYYKEPTYFLIYRAYSMTVLGLYIAVILTDIFIFNLLLLVDFGLQEHLSTSLLAIASVVLASLR